MVAMAAREEEAPSPAASAPSPSSVASPAASPAQNGPAKQLERIASIPVVSRGDGSGAPRLAAAAATAVAAAAAACPTGERCHNLPALPCRRPCADYLEIRHLRDVLTPRDSPFVSTNNAGAGFGACCSQCLLWHRCSPRFHSQQLLRFDDTCPNIHGCSGGYGPGAHQYHEL